MSDKARWNLRGLVQAMRSESPNGIQIGAGGRLLEALRPFRSGLTGRSAQANRTTVRSRGGLARMTQTAG
jgi:hypothetical protein